MDAFGATFHVVTQSRRGEHLVDRGDEALDVGITAFLRGVERLLNHIIGLVLQIFERQILQLRLQFVESEFVGERGVNVGRFDREAAPRFVVRIVLHTTHQHHAAGNEQQHDTHICRLRNEQIAEVVGFEHLLVERLEFVHTIEGGEIFGTGLPFAQPDFTFSQTESFFTDFAGIEPKTRDQFAVGDGSYIVSGHRLLCFVRLREKNGER